jgi:hypothetical protein
MANTSEHISVRLPASLAAELRAEADREQRSLAWVIVQRLGGSNGGSNDNYALRGSGSDAGVSAQRTGDRTALPVLPKAKSGTKRLHTVQSVRRELARSGDAPAQLPPNGPASSEKGSCPHGQRNQIVCRHVSGGC